MTIGEHFESMKIGFAFLAALSLMMIFIGNGALVKGLYAALLVVCLVVIALVSRKDRSRK
ncbi:hypothetical protein ACX80R_10555 [Paeniglutamicibacter antarcticus]|uniref:Uncharacterized protein n=1 Tax=Paeniglutamicibacter antarcticus TaxID=494023 RepID=A0ABP9TLW2_9MICC